MLKTILYYEYRGLRRVGALLLILLAAAAVGAMGVALLLSALEEAVALSFLYSFLTLLYFGLLIAPFILLAVAFITVIYRFYATVFTDEGYLTLMLPVPRGRLFFGKLLAAVIYMAGMALCVILSFFLSLGVTLLAFDVGTVADLGTLIRFFLEGLVTDTLAGVITAVIILLGLLVQGLSLVVLGFAAVTIGGISVKRHRLLGAVLFAVILYYAREFLELLCTLLLGLIFYDGAGATLSDAFGLAVAILSFVLTLTMTVVGYAIAHRLFTRKLELE